MRRNFAVASAVIHVMLATAARANDGAASLSAGGIQFRKLAGVSMESEDLVVSPTVVRVSYRFRNRTAEDITTRVAFPVPEFDEKPDSDIELDVRSNNPMRFSVKVDGAPIRFQTNRVRRNGRVRVTHHWEHTFRAGKETLVEHEYRPVLGAFWFYPEDAKGLAETMREHCVPAGVAKLIARGTHRGFDLHYVLTTAATWDGPIRDFTLTIRQTRPAGRRRFVATCFPGVKRRARGTFVAMHRDFTPKQDLKVLFIEYFPESLEREGNGAHPGVEAERSRDRRSMP